MKIVIMSATAMELEWIQKQSIQTAHELTFETHGVGILSASFQIPVLARNADYLVQFGIAGSYVPHLQPGDVVLVEREQLGDEGAESTEGFLSSVSLQLRNPDTSPFQNDMLINPHLPVANKLYRAKGITVNTVSGSKETITMRQQLFQADIESMEGAAFAFVAAQFSCKAHQIRSISNQIEPRNKENWDIPLAIKQLNNFLKEYFEDLKEMSL